ncbi:hypothetical protein [Roseomonas sp. AR75]|uniref:hypothetical protein n=1 Tax=Roseomonas sp. AR75 TaxID=2562311 RepID=UPI0010C0001A|nr:hypothetical protein [Roseomonas sp. AR75]
MPLSLRRLVVAATLAGGAMACAATPAMAQSYPRVVGQGENLMVDYGPMGQGTLVGGGRVMVTQPNGMDFEIVHLDSVFVQQPRPGYVPMVVGQGENQTTIYVPQATMDQLRQARARQR